MNDIPRGADTPMAWARPTMAVKVGRRAAPPRVTLTGREADARFYFTWDASMEPGAGSLAPTATIVTRRGRDGQEAGSVGRRDAAAR